MEGMALYLVAALLIGFPGSSHGALYTLITPGVLRTDTEEQILVEAHGDNTPKQLDIFVHDFPRKQKILFQKRVDMNPAGDMLVTPTIKIPAEEVSKDSRQNQYVVVQVTGPQVRLEKVVLLSYQSGFVFIQTDKGIYTPGSPVLYRVFSMDHNMRQMDKTVVVEFQTPEGIVVSSNRIDLNFTRPYNLPELGSLGTWKIVAKYEHSPENYTAYFDVRKYVLPSFEVHLQPSEKSFYIDGNENFHVSITARYLYGEEVEGVAFVLFGVKIDGAKKSIPDSLTRIPILDGDGEATLKRDTLRSRFPNLNELVGHTLYASVTVITESGSDMVATEQSGIHIVTSPYQIYFTKTPKYFKPGMPYELTVYVTNPDGSPAAKVPVVSEAIHSEGTTLSDGTAKLILNTPLDTQSLLITVRTNHGDLPRERQATKSMTATAYQTQGGSGNYLHVAITSTEIKPGDNLPVNFNVRGNANSLNQVKYFTYLVGRQPKGAGQNLVAMNLRITPDLIPSFRFVAYYQVGNNEIVADSVWVDVKDTCMGTLVVKGASLTDNQIHMPGAAMKIKLEGDPGAQVGLVAVDKAVYVLNDKYKISQAKIWDTIEKSDFGCTAGGGQNNLGVFEDAGLALTTSTNLNTKQRSDTKCPQPANRRRRSSVLLLDSKASKAAQFQDQDLRKCCEDSMHENPMGYTCEKRAKYIQEGDACKAAFLECCRYIKGILDENQWESGLFLPRNDNEDGFIQDSDIIPRTDFPKSWLWHTVQLTEQPNSNGISSKTMSIYLKESITTWEVLAVSFTPTKGICVAEPYEIKVMKDFFIDLRVPYSVVRKEQVEIRAVLYNYAGRDIYVRVELLYNPAFCSASTEEQRYRQQFTIKALSSRAVPFVIVPLQQGLHDIEVRASVQGWESVSDGVKKKLKVVPEGVQKCIVTIIKLDPRAKGVDGTQREVVKARKLDDKVPDTEIETKITIQADPVAQIIENSIDGSKLNHLIITPSGCGEQNMIRMTAPVIATYYLDTTEQWETLGRNHRNEAVKQIMTGYAQQMVYKKANHSYAAFTNRASSTWLTAYVVKVFAMATKMVAGISHEIICGGVRWLILNRQQPDGAFKENAPVLSGTMQGGIQGDESEVTVTAFTLVALLESKTICNDSVNSLDSSIKKATDYLLKKYEKLQRPYTTALTAYALAAADRLNDDRVLMAASTGKNRWEEYNAHTHNVEGTSYALLALLKMKKFDQTGPIVRWLTDQNFYGGTYGQTQATVMLFQALAEYKIQMPTHKDLNLDIIIKLPERELPLHYRLDATNAILARTAETKLNQDFTVSASGDGTATMTILTVYNAQLQEKANVCNKFHLDVSVENIHLNFKHAKGAKGALMLKICMRYLGEVDSTMTIIDISMLTGFLPDAEDLTRLSEGVDRYISRYEVDNNMAQKVAVIIYLDKVSHSEDECLQFKILKHFEVGFIQPGSVKVYSYYNLDEQCTKFYHPDKGTGLLNKICVGNICRCAAETCSLLSQQEKIDLPLRIQKACASNVDYVYKTKLLRIEEKDGYDIYVMDVLEVIKPGTDENPQANARQYISQRKCQEALNLNVNDDYLIWGLRSDLWPMKDKFSYLITKNTWIERWPHEDECQDEEFQNLCLDFAHLSNILTIFGCPT
uniref:Ophiophagus venom factor n=1 Tax=Ophiophagus hannah TaxID=8665 RepID=VCO3_OPHHA|nr:RecName: Full=Ophiophagus venom factor; Short=OVF; AltName: Full=CVF-like; AltName: Full=Complement C3 homolog; Contains: RecName: Full=OVF alpha chain; Contains: RecName: Full=OVF gamma chain; Contains: RecName: Full=OVF beta chain; Flags: Precursor [Ophiophagus hannah]AFJ59923.1 OVF precursor protein [Ophiophagus hannah]